MKAKWSAIALLIGAIAFGGINTAKAGVQIEVDTPVAAQVLQLLSDLNLSQGQKQKAAEIIAANRDKNREIARDLLKARQNLFETIHAETYDEDEIRNVYRSVSRVEEDLAVRRAQMAGELRAILNDAQRERIAEAKGVLFEKINQRVEQVFACVDIWVDSQIAR